MRRDQRITKGEGFAAARREGKSWPDSLLVLMARPNNLALSRFGFSVGERVRSAVVRNRVKRRLREAARLTRVRNRWDLVFIARKNASSADFHRLRHSMAGLLKRAGVLDASLQSPISSSKVN